MSEPSVSVSPPAASDLELRKTEAIRKLAAHLPDHDDADSIRFKKLAIVEKLLASFEDPNMSPFFLGEIESFHSHPPLRPASAYLGDANLRLQLLREIQSTKMKRQNSSRPWQCLPVAYLSANVWAVFMAAPIEALQDLLRHMRNGEQLYDHLCDTLLFIESHLPAVIQSSGQATTTPSITKVGTWGKAHFAFEPISQPDSHTIRTRLHLLQDINLQYPFLVHRKEPNKRPDTSWWNDLAADPRKFLDPFVNDKFVTEGPLEIGVGSSTTQHIVRDGYVFDIMSEDPSLLPNYDVLDLQYRIDLTAALVGAGEGSDDARSSSTNIEWEGGLSVASGYSHEDL